jgi:hypothetical protein
MPDTEPEEQEEPWNKQMVTSALQVRLDAYRKFIAEWKEDHDGAEPHLDSQP